MDDKAGWITGVIFLTLATSAYPNNSELPAASASETDYAIVSRDVSVQRGDTLAGIALNELGRRAFAPLLADFNGINLDTTLTADSFLRIPIRVPARNEFAEVVFVKGQSTVTRRIVAGALASSSSTSVATPVSNPGTGPVPGFVTDIMPIARNMRILAGDLITTSSTGYVSIAFSSGTVINMQPDTIASLDRLFCLASDDSCQIEINTLQGRVTSTVEARDQQPVYFQITTPYASAAVRGTEFSMNSADNLLVSVLEGGVLVQAQAVTVPLDAGFGLSVEPGEPPGQPTELIPAPVFKRIPARFAIGDTLEWWEQRDAASYTVLLSNDESGLDALSDFELPGDNPNVLDVADSIDEVVEPGDYFITIRGVDSEGLTGFPSNTRITLASIDSSINPVSTEVVREGSEFVITVSGGPDEAMGYEIQISDDESFSDPLSVDVNSNGTAVFRIDEDQVYSRARVLMNPYTVSAFGEVSSN